MDSNIRTQVILAAVNATPASDDAAAWEAEVTRNAVKISLMTADDSNIAKALEAVAGASVFTGTVIRVNKEESSTRAVVTLATGTDREREDALTKAALPAGQEQIRTERTDTPAGLAMAKHIASLAGHKVAVWKEVQSFGNGSGTVRVIAHVEDQGVDPAYAAASA